MTGCAFTHQQVTALYVGAFLDELVRWGVREVVVSPGSRSTPLAMCAYELSRRHPERLRLYVDVDERGAAFFALGLAKSAGRPVACVCTSGTAVANYLPAVVEAATSRVPLVLLTGDRPMRLQGLGAPQTCDQLKIFGDYVRAFRQMPEPAARTCDIAFARQAAREAVIAAMGSGATVSSLCQDSSMSQELEGWYTGCLPWRVPIASRGCARFAGPVHLNFPFDEPLKPDFAVKDLFAVGADDEFPCGVPILASQTVLDSESLILLSMMTFGRRTLVLAGEGTCETIDEAYAVLAWAAKRKLPVLADPLSGLRAFSDECVIDNYDTVLRSEGALRPEVIIRFGRYPVSKVAANTLAPEAFDNIVVDAVQTRDFNSATTVFVPCTPFDFVRQDWIDESDSVQERFFNQWVEMNEAARERILAVEDASDADTLEGAYVRALLERIPAKSLLFSANSMPIRALDTFLVKPAPGEPEKPLAILCNRGQNGIDGTVSTALGAAQRFELATFLTGDFTLLHDLNALALRRELDLHHGSAAGEPDRTIVIVLLNNNGGAIFDMLPQASDDDYFERLFLVPQDVDFAQAAAAFGVAYEKVAGVAEFARAYEAALGRAGIQLIEVTLPLRGVRERYAPYWA